MRLGWYLITKGYKGGRDTYLFRITKNIIKRFEDWDELFEFIGEDTGGGHNYGYNITSTYKGRKKKNWKETVTVYSKKKFYMKNNVKLPKLVKKQIPIKTLRLGISKSEGLIIK